MTIDVQQGDTFTINETGAVYQYRNGACRYLGSQPAFDTSPIRWPEERDIMYGIVHLQGWLEQRTLGFQSVKNMYVLVMEPFEKTFTETHDNTPAGKFIALCKLAERIGT